MVDGVVVEGEYEEKWSYANILNLIFLIAGFTLGIVLVATGFALLPFSFGSSSLLAGIGIKLLVVLSTGLSLASVGKNIGRVVDIFTDKTKKTAEKAFAVIGCALGIGVAIALACAPVLHMTFSFISHATNVVFTRFSQILASMSFVGTLTSMGNKIGGSIDTIKSAILGLKNSDVSITTRLGNLVGCFTGLIISITLLALHQKLAFFSVPVPGEWIHTAVTALNIYMCTGIVGRIGKHIGGAISVVRDSSRSVLEKVATVAWLGVSIAVTAVLARFAPAGQLRNGFVIVTKAIKLLEVKAFFTVNFIGTLISFGNKFGGAIDTCKKLGSNIRSWFSSKKTATNSNAQTTPNNITLNQQMIAKQKIISSPANRMSKSTTVVRQLLAVMRNPASFRRNVEVFLTAGLTLVASILSPATLANIKINQAPNQLEAGQHVSAKKGDDTANPGQTGEAQNSPVPAPGQIHNKNGTQWEERNDVRQEEDEKNDNFDADNSSDKVVITPNQANHNAMQVEIDGEKKIYKENNSQGSLQQYFDGRQKALGKVMAKRHSFYMTKPTSTKQMQGSGRNADMDAASFYKYRKNTF